MPAITASMVADLRAKTDAPMMECKKALTEADGDMAKAEEILRVKLGSKASKAASRVTAEGVVSSAVDGTTAALVEINCETDFVSKNDSFLAFAKSVAELIAKHNPADVAAVGDLPLSQDGFGPTVEEVRKGLIGKIGENMSIRRFKRYAGGSKLASYLHGARIGVLVEFDGDDVAAKDVAMHIAAMKPVSLSSADVPAALIETERSVATAKAAESGKPADIAAKMIEGAIQKYLKEVSLFNQVFVKAADGKQTVEAYLKSANTTVNTTRKTAWYSFRERRGSTGCTSFKRAPPSAISKTGSARPSTASWARAKCSAASPCWSTTCWRSAPCGPSRTPPSTSFPIKRSSTCVGGMKPSANISRTPSASACWTARMRRSSPKARRPEPTPCRCSASR